MQNLYADLQHLLAQDERLVTADGALLKNLVIELGLKLDPALLRLLLSHDRIRQHFFCTPDCTSDWQSDECTPDWQSDECTPDCQSGVHGERRSDWQSDLRGILVFDKDKFLQFVNNKAFLPDSYTAFKNKIGLSDDGGDTFLSRRRDVTLVWPYKDCVLEGGQTQEDARRNEIFWNTTLAPDDINRLLDPKVLTGWQRYDAQGAHSVTGLRPDDNLIVKGNNLLALHSLARRFAGKVKLIYIDPPYNTGNDSFGYNDHFNHSTWLTFMRSRLEVARGLLQKDGAIFVNCDDNEQAYLKVLMDEIFSQDNLVANFIWNHRKSSQNDIDVSLSHNYLLCYALDRRIFRLNSLSVDGDKFSNPDNDPRGPWTADPFDAPNIRPNLTYPIVNPNTDEEHWPPEGRCWRFTQEKYREALNDKRIIFGKTGTARPQYKRFLFEAEERGINTSTIWDNVGTATEATKELMKLFQSKNVFSTPKPERLLQRILHIGSNEGDLVLDFFAGSGTTGAVALKMGRRFALVEQMDYLETTTIPRLQKVIAGEQGGISKDVGWQGGGDFVYCELLQWNERFVRRIEAATSTADLQALWRDMQTQAFLSYRVDVAAVNANAKAFADLALDEQKRFLLEILDYNALYVNLSEIDDTDYAVSTEDKRLNTQFYCMPDCQSGVRTPDWQSGVQSGER